jgi:Xaa-Pro dipeptidase
MPAKRKKKVEPKAIRRSDVDPKRAAAAAPDGLYDPADPDHRWDRPLQAPGRMQVDFEERVDFRRLHDYRLARTRNALAKSGLGALLVFDQYNIRYISSTVIGEWARDKLTRWCLLTGNGEPWVWDFGSAARHHKIYAPWLPKNHCLAGLAGLRGAVSPKVGLFENAAREIRDILAEEGVADMPLGIDVVEPPFLFALQKLGIEVRDGQQVMLDAREIKSHDEITLLNMAAAMGDGVYQDIYEALKPGVRESEIVGMATRRLYEMGSDCVEAINAIAGERCSPHPHNFTDRLIRPGDQAYFDIIQSYMGYRTCYYRTFTVGSATAPQIDAYKKARRWMDDAIAMLKPGVSTDEVARAFPKSTEIGFETEMAAFGLNFCHGLGLGLHERPLISRVNSFKDPYELKAGMVFAVETFCPATDGISAARIEEEVVLTPGGAKVITLFPAQELPIANRY